MLVAGLDACPYVNSMRLYPTLSISFLPPCARTPVLDRDRERTSDAERSANESRTIGP